MLQNRARLGLYLLHAHMESLACFTQFAQVLQTDRHSAENAIQLRLVAAPLSLIVEIEQIAAAAAQGTSQRAIK